MIEQCQQHHLLSSPCKWCEFEEKFTHIVRHPDTTAVVVRDASTAFGEEGSDAELYFEVRAIVRVPLP